MIEKFNYYLPDSSGFPDFPVTVTFEWEYERASKDCPARDYLGILHWAYYGEKNPLIEEWILDHFEDIEVSAWECDPIEIVE